MADTEQSETVAPSNSKTDATPAAAPPVDNDSEELRKQLEQAKMEANMLRNQKDKLEKDQADAAKKELEEKEEYRTLYEKEKAEREAILTERAEAEKKTQLDADSKALFDKFSPEVVDIAKTTGLTLEDTTETAKSALEEKLTAIAGKVKSPSVSGNNPAPQVNAPNVASEEVIKSMRSGNKEARREYIHQSPSIQAVKEELQRQVGVNFSQNQ